MAGTYGVLIPGAIQATNNDSLVKSAKCASALENSNVVSLGALSTTAGEDEVYVAATPATASLDTAIYYMVNEPVNVLTDSKYLGLNDDPRNFNIAANKIFSCYKPKVGDEIMISADGLGGSKASNTLIIPADNTGELTWGASATGVSLAYELIDTITQSIPEGQFYNTRVTFYKFLCVKAQ
jgi:hypothetical protein